MKALKFTVSGSFHSNKQIFDYDGVTGVVPFQDHDIATMHVMTRFVPLWIAKDARYKNRIESVRECFIENIEEVTHEFSFVGKNIIDMSQEELQDLALAKDFRQIPIVRAASNIVARTKAYIECAIAFNHEDPSMVRDKITGNFVKREINIRDMPPMIITDALMRRDDTLKLSNEEILAGEVGKRINAEEVMKVKKARPKE